MATWPNDHCSSHAADRFHTLLILDSIIALSRYHYELFSYIYFHLDV